MFVTLGQLAQATQPQPPATWRSRLAPIQDAITAKNWTAVVSAADVLAKQAGTAEATPVQRIALSVKTAAGAVATGGSPDDVTKAVADLAQVAELEDLATDADRNLSAQLIVQQINQLNTDIAAFMAKHSGAYAIWDKLRGGADITPLTTEVKQVQDLVDTTPLTVLGRQQLNTRISQAAASIKPEIDWGTIAVGLGTVGGLAILKWGLGKAQAVAVVHVQKHASKTKLGQKLGIKAAEEEKPKKKKSKKKAAAKGEPAKGA